MLESLDTLIQKYRMLPRGCTVLCAVSGGADSVCLLHALYRLRPRLGFHLVAAHYNHRLRGEESDRDQRFVQQFVRLCCGPDRGGQEALLPPVPLLVGGGDVAAVAARDRLGLEETAREMRYAFLRRAAAECGATVIATAHNADDNAETLLLHLVRGCGLRGLGGMSPCGGGLIRPLLTTTRAQIEDYLRFYGLPHVEDSSNREDAYTRNRIRHRVVPELEAICPGFALRLADTARLIEQDEALLSAQAGQALEAAQMEGESLTLPAAAVAALPQPLAVRAARALLGRMNGGDDSCTAAHLESLVALCRSGRPSARLCLPGGLTAWREYDQLLLSRTPSPPPPPARPLPLPGAVRFGAWQVSGAAARYLGQPQRPCDFYLALAPGEALLVRPRRAGDQLSPPGRPRKSLKKWMIDEKIPARLRDVLPVLECRGRAVAAARLGPDRDFLPEPGQPAWHVTLAQDGPQQPPQGG